MADLDVDGKKQTLWADFGSKTVAATVPDSA